MHVLGACPAFERCGDVVAHQCASIWKTYCKASEGSFLNERCVDVFVGTSKLKTVYCPSSLAELTSCRSCGACGGSGVCCDMP